MKKAVFIGKSLNDLKELFLEKFNFRSEHSLPPFYITDPQTNITYQLENINDIYPNCIIELKLPKLGLIFFFEYLFIYLKRTKKRNWIWICNISKTKISFYNGWSSCSWKILYCKKNCSLFKVDWCFYNAI